MIASDTSHINLFCRGTARAQNGVATLTVAVVLLFVVTLAAMFVNRSQLFDLKVSTNHYRYTQAYEMAEKGMELTLAWLQSRAAIPDDQNIIRLPGQPVICQTNQVIPIRYAKWGCDTGQTTGSAQCLADRYEYLQPDPLCSPGFPVAVSADQQPSTAAFEVNIKVRRLKSTVSELYRLEIISEARSPNFDTSTDIQKSRALVRQSVAIHPMPGRIIPPNPGVPILVRDVVSVRNSPKTRPEACIAPCTGGEGYSVATLQPNLDDFSPRTIDLFNKADPPVNILQLGINDFTVFDIIFRGVSQCDMLELSKKQASTIADPMDRTVFYYGSCDGDVGYALPSNNQLPADAFPTGTSTKPIIVIVAEGAYASSKKCPSLNSGNGTLYGIFYFGGDCDANGFGSTKVEGTIAVEGSLLNMNATAFFGYNPLTHTTSDYDVITGVGNLAPGRLARIPGSWRDF